MARVRGFHAELIKNKFKEVMDSKNYAFFENGKYNVNIIGVRREDGTPNKFDDMLVAIYKDRSDEWTVDSYRITTDPGLYYLNNPMNVKGTAILVPDQYRGVYKVDGHGQTGYEALCQRSGPVRVYRDPDRDNRHDMKNSTIDKGMFGINIHRASSRYEEMDKIDKWSAGCQVFKNLSDFNEFMKLIKTSVKFYSNSFTYTLLEEEDLNG